MATIQIRNMPGSVHSAYLARAATAGTSLREYMLAEIVRNAELRAPAELVADVEAQLRTEGGEGFSRESSAQQLHTDRRAH